MTMFPEPYTKQWLKVESIQSHYDHVLEKHYLTIHSVTFKKETIVVNVECNACTFRNQEVWPK